MSVIPNRMHVALPRARLCAGPSASEAAIEAVQIARAHSHGPTPPLPAVAIEAMCSDWWARLHSANAPAAGVGAVRDRTAAALTAARERASPHLDVLRERTSVALSAKDRWAEHREGRGEHV